MSKGTWQILSLGFIGFILLVLVHGLEGTARTRDLYQKVSRILDSHRRSEHLLDNLQSDVLSSSIAVRDRLIDRTSADSTRYEQELLRLKAGTMRYLEELQNAESGVDPENLRKLRAELDAFWQTLDPLIEKPSRAIALHSLRDRLLAHRQMIASTTRRIRDLNAAALEQEKAEIDRSQADFESEQMTVILSLLFIGLLVCVGCILLLYRLDRRARREAEKTRAAHRRVRALSQRLLETQENERKQISRDLHDQVGQLLTGLRMEIDSLEAFAVFNPPQFVQGLDELRRLASDCLGVVRNLATGLRPAVLDDLGLEPAVRWLVEEFSRRTGIRAEVKLSGRLRDVWDPQRTCIYRIIQEALTNCARHSRAKHVTVEIDQSDTFLRAQIIDDGIGMDTEASDYRGLGMIGMQERAEELGGQMQVRSRKGQGTSIQVAIPLPSGAVDGVQPGKVCPSH